MVNDRIPDEWFIEWYDSDSGVWDQEKDEAGKRVYYRSLTEASLAFRRVIPLREIAYIRFVPGQSGRADASPLPPPGSAGEQLAAVQATIANMALLPHDHDCYLRPNLAERALSVLSEITASPKIISGPEAITLTWVVGGGKIYLTISEDDLDIMMIAEGRRTDARATLPPPAFVGVDLAKGQDQTARWLVLPEEGSAGEKEMVERMIERSYGSDWMKDPDLLRSMPHHRAQIRQVLDMLRAAFGGSGAEGEESGE